MAKKTLLSPPNKVQVISMVKKYKNLTAARGQDDCLFFLDECQKYIFRLPNLKKMILFGVRSGSHIPGDKKANSDNSGSSGAVDATMAHPTPCSNGYRM